MKLRASGFTLALLLLVGTALPVLAQGIANPPGDGANGGIDVPSLKFVVAGPDAGEIEQITGIWAHRPTTQGQPVSVQFAESRIKDAGGNTINSPDNPRVLGVTADIIPGMPEDFGCSNHGITGSINRSIDGANAGCFHWQRSLTGRSAAAGYYKLEIGVQDQVQPALWYTRTFFRWYRLQTKEINWVVTDQYGQAVVGAKLNETSPATAYFGETDSGGGLITHIGVGTHTFAWTCPGYEAVTLTNYLVSGTTTVTQRVTMINTGNGGPPPNSGAGLEVLVQRQDNGNNIAFATVTVQGKIGQTDSSGKVTFKGLASGASIVKAKASGMAAGGTTVQLIGGTLKKLTCKMHATAAPVWEESALDQPGSQGFWEWLFVPKNATLQQWQAFITQLKAWGPFGFVSQAATLFGQGLQVPGGPMVWTFSVPYYGGAGGSAINGSIDWREPLQGSQTYEDGGKGSVFGAMRATGRSILGWVVWLGFTWALIMWVRPRLSW